MHAIAAGICRLKAESADRALPFRFLARVGGLPIDPAGVPRTVRSGCRAPESTNTTNPSNQSAPLGEGMRSGVRVRASAIAEVGGLVGFTSAQPDLSAPSLN